MPAQAQTTIWSADLTVGYGTGEGVFFGYYHPSFNLSKRRGALTSNTFTVNSSTFRVVLLQYYRDSNNLRLIVERTSGSNGLNGNSYRLTIDDRIFFIPDPPSKRLKFIFRGVGLKWKDGDKISVKLEVLPKLSEATLKNIRLRDNLGDLIFRGGSYIDYLQSFDIDVTPIHFHPDITSYRIGLGRRFLGRSFRLKATPEDGATVSFIGKVRAESSNEATLLPDLGENQFTVRVTEGSVTRDYTLNIERYIPSDMIVPRNSQPCFGASEEAMLKTLNVVPSPGSLISFTPEVDGSERQYTAVVSNNATHARVTAEGAHSTSRTFVQTGTWKPVLQPMELKENLLHTT